MAKITIDKQLQNKIYNEKHIFIEEGIYTINKNLLIEAPSSIRGCNLASVYRGGGYTHINPNGFIQNCTIGRYCSIATGVKIGNGEHPTNWLSVNACQYIKNFHNYDNILKNPIYRKEFKPYKHTVIGNDVWIGANVYIKDGVKIGDGAIIGANAVVTKDIEPYAIVAGVPAKLIRYRFPSEIIDKLLRLKWWEYDMSEFGEIDFNNIEKAIEQLEKKLPTLEKYNPLIIDAEYLKRVDHVKKILFGLIKVKENCYSKRVFFLGIKIYRKPIK